MGIEFTFVDPDCTDEELNAAFRPNTKAVFGETIANPALTVLDIEQLCQGGPRPRRPPDHGQHLRHPGELPALRVGVPTS